MSEGNQICCDIESGICKLPLQNVPDLNISAVDQSPKVKITYFTDPICSSCWGIEPQLRKLKLEYGNYFQIEYRMGGLLQSWATYAGSDVRKPEDVAIHWEKAGQYYDMPIDGNVWIEDPMESSYIPCIAVKAAQLQDEQKAQHFLRRIKEMVFLEKKNISKIDHLKSAAVSCGLDGDALIEAMDGIAKIKFEEDLQYAKLFSIKGFPSIVFTDANNDHYLLYGYKPYEEFEQAILKWNPNARRTPMNTQYSNLFSVYPSLTTKEFSVLAHKNKAEAETFLNELYELGKLNRYSSRNGYLWTSNDTSI
jgi:putative protein-disulfide isomerase